MDVVEILHTIIKKIEDLERKIDLFVKINELPPNLTLSEASEFLRCSEKTLIRKINDGVIAKSSEPGKKIIIAKSEIINYLKSKAA